MQIFFVRCSWNFSIIGVSDKTFDIDSKRPKIRKINFLEKKRIICISKYIKILYLYHITSLKMEFHFMFYQPIFIIKSSFAIGTIERLLFRMWVQMFIQEILSSESSRTNDTVMGPFIVMNFHMTLVAINGNFCSTNFTILVIMVIFDM